MNVQFMEQHKVFVILSSLPSEFDMLVMSLETLPDAQLTLEYLMSRLLQEQQCRDERSDSGEKNHTRADQESWKRNPDDSVKHRTPATDREQRGHAMAIKHCFDCESEQHHSFKRQRQSTSSLQMLRRRQKREDFSCEENKR